MSGVGDQLSALKALRDECQNGVRGLEERATRPTATSPRTSRSQERWHAARWPRRNSRDTQLESLLNQSLPDWPMVRQVLARRRGICDCPEPGGNRRAALSGAFLRRSIGCGRMPAGSRPSWPVTRKTGSRPTNITRPRKTPSARCRAKAPGSGGEWARLLEQVRGAAVDLAHSERLAQEDVRLARQAEAEIQEAVLTLRKARAYFSMGVTLNTQGAESQVSQAEQAYRFAELRAGHTDRERRDPAGPPGPQCRRAASILAAPDAN